MIALPSILLFLATLSHVTACPLSYSHKPTVYIIRHGEKPPDPNDSGLSAEGVKRAQCVREVFGDHSPYDIGHIMAPRINSRGQHRRSYETVQPLANDLDIPVDVSCRRNRVHCVSKTVRRYRGCGNILISWRHGKMEEMARDLGVEDPPEYPENRYDLIWTIPFPYDKITDVRSEACPDLDIPNALTIQA